MAVSAATSSINSGSILEKGRRSSTDLVPTSTGPSSELKSTTAQDFQEGGTKAWLTVAGSSAALFTSFGFVNCIGLFQALYETDQLKNYSTSEVSWITSTEFFFMLLFCPLSGKLFDNYGPRLPLAIGSVMHPFGLMMTSISHEYYQIMLSQSVCSGIGCSLIFIPAMTASQTWFRQKRGIAGGLTVAGASLGGVIFPLMVQHLVPQVGFGWTMRICAFLILFLLAFANLTINSNLQHTSRPFNLMDYLGPLREVNFCLMCVSVFFLYWAMFVPFDYLVVEAIHYGMSPALALSLVPILNGASFIGRTVPNIVADRIGRFNVMVLMTLWSAILVLGLWLPGRGNGAIITFATLFGISSGAGIGLGPVLITSISPMKELGYRLGTILAIAAVATLTSPPIGGAIVAHESGDYNYACVFSGVSFLATTVGILVLRIRLAGWKLIANI